MELELNTLSGEVIGSAIERIKEGVKRVANRL